MKTDNNLLFGVLALQADLINSHQFVESCMIWSELRRGSLADLLIKRGWIQLADRTRIDYLLKRKLKTPRSDTSATPVSLSNDINLCPTEKQNADTRHAFTKLPWQCEADPMTTIDRVSSHRERYTLDHLHAIGGIGRVWVARDNQLQRDVALKELRPERAGDSALAERFFREAQITGQLEHPGVIPVYELSHRSDGHQPFYTMRLIKGRTLTDAIRAYHRKLELGQSDGFEFLLLLNAFVTVCNTVAYAHSRSIVHRDLKGQNVALGDFGEVVVLDWGLAKVVECGGEEQNTSPIVFDWKQSGDAGLTVHGQALGTPSYMAPEQAAGRLDMIDTRTDVYGLGAMLYEILTGQPPFSGAEIPEVLRRVQEDKPIPPARLNPDVSHALEAVCLRALAKTPADRYASASELGQQVQHWLAESADRKQADQHRARFFALSLDLMVIAGFDGFFKQLNPAWERCLGWTIEELQAKPWVEFVHPDDIEQTLAVAARLNVGNMVFLHENRYRCKDGSYRWLQWTAQEIVGQQLSYAVARDITDQKLAEEARRESDERYRSVITAMKEGVVLFAADGNILACNASAERILGLTAEQIVGRSARDPRWRAIHEDGSPFPEDEFPAIVSLRTGNPCRDVVMGIHKPDNTLNWISLNSQPLFRETECRPYAVMSSFSDITGHIRLEEELHQIRAELDRFRERIL